MESATSTNSEVSSKSPDDAAVVHADGTASRASAEKPPKLNRVARAITRRTTDLLAIAIVSLGILSVSGRLQEWWNTDPNAVLNPLTAATDVAGSQRLWDTDQSPVRIRAGSIPVEMQRRVLSGTQDEAESVLQAWCREQLEAAAASPANSFSPVSDFELRLLKVLPKVEPIEEAAGFWQLFRVTGEVSFFPGTLFVGVRNHTGVDESVEATVVSDRKRVVCQAMAVPYGENQWTAFLLSMTSSKSDADLALPLPDETEIVLSLTSASGDMLCAFRPGPRSHASIDEWYLEIDSRLRQAGWQRTRDWAQSAGGWDARFEGDLYSDETSSSAIEVSLRISATGMPTGLANVIVSANAVSEKAAHTNE